MTGTKDTIQVVLIVTSGAAASMLLHLGVLESALVGGTVGAISELAFIVYERLPKIVIK